MGGTPKMPIASSPLDKKLQSLGHDLTKSVESRQIHYYEEQRAKLNLEYLKQTEREAGLFNTPWKPSDYDLSPQTKLLVQPSTLPINGNKVDPNAAHYESSLFSSSLSELFNKKVTLMSSDTLFDKSIDAINSNYGEDEPFESSEEIEAQTIGNLLPDDDDLFEYISHPNNADDVEDDIFCTIGGMEIEEIDRSGYNNSTEVTDSTSNNQQGELNGSFTGDHPFGEHPSRTLFVRNINSNVEDAELRDLFEQYGHIRSLYTACKHRGFVMVSYSDIRSARNAKKELQNKPLRRRKLDIHFSIPKDNPPEKDINQGTLVVFNLEASVSNDDLCQIFGVYGEIMEIRETPNKHHHKFIEFYDIRAAEAALRSLNRRDIAGKRIKLEPSRPGGSRRCNAMQQLSPGLQQDDVGGCQQQIISPNNSSEAFGTIPVGIIASKGFDLAAVQGLQSVSQAPISSFVDSTFNGLPSSVPHNFSPVRSASVSNHSNPHVSELCHSMGQRTFGFQCIHPHSLPEYQENILQGIPYDSSSISSMGIDVTRSAEGVDDQHTAIGSPGFGIQNFEHTERAFGASANGSYPLHANQHGWSNSNLFHSFTGPVLWPNNPFVNSIPHHASPQLHGLPRTPHMLNTIPHVPHHHVGSAPTMNPSVWDRCHAYVGDPADASAFHPGSLGSVGFSGSSPINPMELAPRSIFSHIGGKFVEPPISSLHVGLPSSQQRCHMYHGRNGISLPTAFDAPNDRIRSRRNEISSNQTENKRQYELDIERIIRGEDSRTTLMIKNIPNKYTSKMLLAAIDELHRGTYDFIYLPIDFKNKCNVGYAFINMIDPQKIIPFHKTFNGKKWEKFNSEKVASLAYARIQGKAALISHFQNSSLMNEDKRCRPILFHSDGPNAGDQEPFPVGANIRSRPGRLRNHNNEDHHQDGSLSSANEEENLNGMTSSCGSTKD